jgi:BirA family biotin operon repressor/biotin-[acetyl-CoA-carboxylase] ligase
MVQHLDVVRALADGELHSGSQLARTLGVSRAAVWKHVAALGEYGLKVVAMRGRGYRLELPLELLSSDQIRDQLSATGARMVRSLEVLDETDSTNLHLLRRAAAADIHGCVCLAEFQRVGRGRRGRHWQSPLGGGIWLSIGWRFDTNLESITALGLAVSVAVIRALHAAGAADLGIKWPNDIVFRGRKLAGMLVEIVGEAGGPCTAVIGLGVNTAMPSSCMRLIDQPVTDLRSACTGEVRRNALAASLIDEIVAMAGDFEGSGFRKLHGEWTRYDVLLNRPVTVELPRETLHGVAGGIDENGALRIRCNGAERRLTAGDVSVRPNG